MADLPGLNPQLYPFTGKYHVLPGDVRMHYLDEGPREAVPVVMVHGNPTWSFYYRELVKALRENRRCLVPDHIGCGLSDRPGDDRYDYTLGRRIDDLEHWLGDVVPEGPLDLVVHDWGGSIGLGWAVRHPERIRRLVILNTAAFHIPPGKRLPLALWFARTRIGAWGILRLNAFSGIAAQAAVKQSLPREVCHGYTAPYRGGVERRLATLRFVQDIPLRETDPAWPVLTAVEAGLPRLADKPILFGWGGQDFVFDDIVLDHWRKLWPGAEVKYFPEAGHYVLEDAAGELIPLIVSHLDNDEINHEGHEGREKR